MVPTIGIGISVPSASPKPAPTALNNVCVGGSPERSEEIATMMGPTMGILIPCAALATPFIILLMPEKFFAASLPNSLVISLPGALLIPLFAIDATPDAFFATVSTTS